MERLYDFEEECVEGFFREQEVFLHQSTDERIKSTTERVENMSQKIEDINQKENLQTATVQNIEFRLRKMEESAEQILSHLAVIHRFMSTHTSVNSENIQSSLGNVSNDVRVRSISENEAAVNLQANPRRKFNRSLTEVRHDSYVFDELLSSEVRTVPEENESVRSKEALNEPAEPPELPSLKVSTHFEENEVFEQNVPGRPREHSVSITKPQSIIIRQETTSTESKDTITPTIENSDAHTLIGEALSVDDLGDINFESEFQIDFSFYIYLIIVKN